MMKAILIDPPAGWVYGFPKEIPSHKQDDVNKWLVEEGYPKRLIDDMGDGFYYRTITVREK